MTPAKKTFRWTFLILLGLGILFGLMILLAPDAASLSINGEQKTGVEALLWAAGLGAGFGVFFGLVLAGIVKLATRGTRPA